MHRETKAKAISPEVKKAVFARDHGECVLCHCPGEPNAHYISRAQGGLGIEENILTLCPKCHRKFDQSVHRVLIRAQLRAYLKSQYRDWDESKLYYRKDF